MTTAKISSFRWKPVNADIYDFSEETATFHALGTKYFRPAVGNLEMKPNTGKYFYQMTVTSDNMKVGLCTSDADMLAEMGHGNGLFSCFLQTGACEAAGVEYRRLWRLLVPTSGGILAFMYDSDEGTLQLFLNTEFCGTIVTAECGLKGKTVYPAVGIAGIEEHNNIIGNGMKKAVVGTVPRLPKGIFAAA